MRSQIAKSYFSNSKGDRDLKATISIGVAIYPDGVVSSSQLLEKVDKAMYLAKNDGRNRVCVAPSSGRKEGKLVQ
jgi:diguanylate cyclase